MKLFVLALLSISATAVQQTLQAEHQMAAFADQDMAEMAAYYKGKTMADLSAQEKDVFADLLNGITAQLIPAVQPLVLGILKDKGFCPYNLNQNIVAKSTTIPLIGEVGFNVTLGEIEGLCTVNIDSLVFGTDGSSITVTLHASLGAGSFSVDGSVTIGGTDIATTGTVGVSGVTVSAEAKVAITNAGALFGMIGGDVLKSLGHALRITAVPDSVEVTKPTSVTLGLSGIGSANLLNSDLINYILDAVWEPAMTKLLPLIAGFANDFLAQYFPGN